jgi:hypothetical protein
MIYAGIGSRKTPVDVLELMHNLGKNLGKAGAMLRSGGAKGADKAFELGCISVDGEKEIFLPYKGFNGSDSPFYTVTPEARRIAKQFHPNWPGLGDVGRDFMGRNAYQVLGYKLDTPAHLIICWTPGGKITGGTGQALRMAQHFNIPVVNLASQSLEEASEIIMETMEKAS